jgi:hypothetical protein
MGCDHGAQCFFCETKSDPTKPPTAKAVASFAKHGVLEYITKNGDTLAMPVTDYVKNLYETEAKNFYKFITQQSTVKDIQISFLETMAQNSSFDYDLVNFDQLATKQDHA